MTYAHPVYQSYIDSHSLEQIPIHDVIYIYGLHASHHFTQGMTSLKA